MAELRIGSIIVPSRGVPGEGAHELPRYRVEKVLGSGGFGITYLAIKEPLSGPSDADFSQLLWLPPGAPVAIKEFYPEQLAERGRDDALVLPGYSDEKREHFELFFTRFRKEAERLFLLTCLRALRAVAEAPDVRLRDADQVQVERVRSFVAGLHAREPRALIDEALDFIIDFDDAMRDVALAAFAEAPLPIVYDFFEANGTAYYVMEYLEGGTLKQARGRPKQGAAGVPWPYDSFVPLASTMLKGVAELHTAVPGNPIIHCDIKPDNVMFRERGTAHPVLIDVGLSRSMRGPNKEDISSLVPALALRYASPELIAGVYQTGSGGPIGPWSDIYSSAMTLLEAATGAQVNVPAGVPYGDRKALTSALDKALDSLPAEYPTRVRSGLRAALAEDTARRPQSVASWEGMLRLEEPEPPPPARPSPMLFGAVAAGAVGVVLLGVALMGGLGGSEREGDPQPAATASPDEIEPSPLATETDAGGPSPDPATTENPPDQTATGGDTTPRPIETEEPAPPSPPARSISFSAQQTAALGVGSVSTITGEGARQGLARTSGGPVVDPIVINFVRSDGAIAGAGISDGSRFARSCAGGSAANELARVVNGGTACLIGTAGQRVSVRPLQEVPPAE